MVRYICFCFYGLIGFVCGVEVCVSGIGFKRNLCLKCVFNDVGDFCEEYGLSLRENVYGSSNKDGTSLCNEFYLLDKLYPKFVD